MEGRSVKVVNERNGGASQQCQREPRGTAPEWNRFCQLSLFRWMELENRSVRKKEGEGERNEIVQVKNGEQGYGWNDGSGGQKIMKLNRFVILKIVLLEKKAKAEISTVLITICEY